MPNGSRLQLPSGADAVKSSQSSQSESEQMEPVRVPSFEEQANVPCIVVPEVTVKVWHAVPPSSNRVTMYRVLPVALQFMSFQPVTAIVASPWALTKAQANASKVNTSKFFIFLMPGAKL